MSELFNNLARSTLAASILASDLSLSVQSGDGNALFPAITAPDFYRCVLLKKSTGDVEIVTVTARSSDTFTVSRAQEGIGNASPVAFSFDAGDIIELRPTKKFFDSLAAGSSSTNVQQGIFLFGNDTGAADVYVAAMNPTSASLALGQELRLKIGASNTNTGIAASIKLDGLSSVPIKTESGNNPVAGSIKAGFVHTFIYDGTSFILQNSGLMLTASGFNAEGKRITNVAAGVSSTDVSTIGGKENIVNKSGIEMDVGDTFSCFVVFNKLDISSLEGDVTANYSAGDTIEISDGALLSEIMIIRSVTYTGTVTRIFFTGTPVVTSPYDRCSDGLWYAPDNTQDVIAKKDLVAEQGGVVILPVPYTAFTSTGTGKQGAYSIDFDYYYQTSASAVIVSGLLSGSTADILKGYGPSGSSVTGVAIASGELGYSGAVIIPVDPADTSYSIYWGQFSTDNVVVKMIGYIK